jgi:hypothetical protein
MTDDGRQVMAKAHSFETTSQMMFVMSSIKKIPNFILIWQKEHGYHGHFLFLIGYFFISSPCQRQSEREDFLEINQSETRIACGGHVY